LEDYKYFRLSPYGDGEGVTIMAAKKKAAAKKKKK